jgi:putative transposase
VLRVCSALGPKRHRQESFTLSTDQLFVDTMRDAVGLFLNHPENVLVLSDGAKSCCHALERTQTMLPLGLGRVEGGTHEYFPHGITTLFTVLDIVTGEVLTDFQPCYRHQELLLYPRLIGAKVLPDLFIHLAIDNYAVHKHGHVKAWLMHPVRCHRHSISTCSSWPNRSSAGSRPSTCRAIRPGSLRVGN